ncbi:MAG: hypothetical protein ICV87_07970, partial [Gemmatimonadetes bacterium]|nr:hypothetical protein [Gemmatimonadota bacterium]
MEAPLQVVLGDDGKGGPQRPQLLRVAHPRRFPPLRERVAARAEVAHLLQQPPTLARITGHSCVPAPEAFFDGFAIRHSESTSEAVALLTPDVALCAACAAEMRDSADRRHGYPFLTCTACGPRYSITRQLPYDREHTTMD